jgi:ribose transport system ATP-binding protein
MANIPLLKVSHVSKYFANVTALDDISFELHSGKILALLGENGAGKSTLVNILCGLFQPDKGEINIEGKPVRFTNPKDAYNLGITVIHQELNLAQELNVAENIFLGDKPQKTFLKFFKCIDFKTMYEESERYLKLFGRNLSPKALISDLSPTEKQLLEILKGMRRQSRIFLMDEPTAGLDEAEVDSLLRLIHQLKTQGVTIIYVSHILEEVQKIADEIMVLRDGKLVNIVKAANIQIDEIVKMMVGREVTDNTEKRQARTFDKIVLNVKHLSTADNYVNDVNFELHKGEILGLAGLTVSGRSEILRALYGAQKIRSGEISVEGKVYRYTNTKQASRIGFGFIPRDRKEEGIFSIRSIKENITISNIKSVSGKLGFINKKKESFLGKDIVNRLRIKTPDISTLTGFLSGGNQQKVIFGRWVVAKPKILLLDEPTRGIDIGAKAEIARIIKELSHDGISTVISSSEIPELIALCDRILIMFEGRITREFTRDVITKEIVVSSILGGTQN